MRFVCSFSLFFLAACATPEVQQVKLNDGSVDVTCQLTMDECLRRVQDQCDHQRYRILEGVSETRLRDAPPFEKAYHTSRVHIACNNAGGEPLFSFGGKSPPKSPPAPAKPPTVRCAPGETRECVGPGACKGGQACAADGKGFGSCDCGPVTPAPVAAPATDPSAPATAPATPNAATPPASAP